ncbi:MAG: hypothetical protein LIR35_01800 [Bacteroidota bacterium]|nr:hypothetical protein [Bacteroidota bacterium]
MKRIGYIFMVMSLMLAGCSERETIPDEDGVVMLSGVSKAGSSADDTYMALLLDKSSRLFTGLKGSYRQKDAKEWMTPCRVDAEGTWIADGSLYGLRSNNINSNTYQMTVVSPAIAPDWHMPAVVDPPTPERWGFSIDREGPARYISHPVTVTVNGNHVNKKYVWQFPEDNKLTDRRARISLKLQCGEDLELVTVDRVEIKDIYSTAKYDLALDSLVSYSVDAVGEVLYPDTDPVIELRHGEPAVNVASGFFLFALDYVARDEEFHYLHKIPRVVLSMGGSEVSVPFYHRLKPQYDYTYTLIVNSAFIKLDVTAEPWSPYPSRDHVIDGPLTDTFTFDRNGWHDWDGGTSTI